MGRPVGVKNSRPRSDKSPIPSVIRRAAAAKKYEKTKNGFLMRAYKNMFHRVTGVQKKKAHLYLGLQILPKHEFYEWSKQSVEFNKLFDEWVDSSYNRKLSPSIDRIDADKGYIKENIRWTTHSENSKNTRRWL
jgi:hypothetical protein